MVWLAVKIILPPDEYFADALLRAALHFFDPGIFQTDIALLLLATILGYVIAYLAFSRIVPRKAHLCAGAALVLALAIYWLCCDQSVHGQVRFVISLRSNNGAMRFELLKAIKSAL